MHIHVRVGRLGWALLDLVVKLPRGFSPPSVSKWKDPRSTFTASEIFHLRGRARMQEFLQHASAKHKTESMCFIHLVARSSELPQALHDLHAVRMTSILSLLSLT